MPRSPAAPHPHAPGRDVDAPPIVSRLTHLTFGLWFPFFRWLVLRIPPEWVARLAAATAERAIWAREPVREAILENHAAVLGLPPWRREVEESARAMLGHHSRSWIDLLRFSSRPPTDLAAVVPCRVGTEHLLAARDAGRGAILLTAHVGNFEIGGFFLREVGLKVAVVYLPDPSPVVERDRTGARDRLGIRSLPVTSEFSAVKILRSLEEGYFVAIQGDRDYAGTGRTMPFLGRSVSFPVGPFRIAAAAGVPLLPVFILRSKDGTYRTIVESPIRVEAAARGEREEAERAAMEVFVSILERTIRQNGEQWYMFSRFWGPLV
jgi:KDO2-lipid IV(A) lauroyltransferase